MHLVGYVVFRQRYALRVINLILLILYFLLQNSHYLKISNVIWLGCAVTNHSVGCFVVVVCVVDELTCKPAAWISIGRAPQNGRRTIG